MQVCQGCGAGDLETEIDFRSQPPVQAFLDEAGLGQPEMHYPLRLLRCGKCDLVQLGYVVDPRIVFPPDYPYQSAMTKILREDFADLASKAVGRLSLRPSDLAVDIGSNDGTLLKAFRAHGMRVVGVEPSDVAQIAEHAGIPTVQTFFDDGVAEQIAKEHGPARIVTAANVLAHVNSLDSLLAGVGRLIDPDGVFISESHYLLDLVEKLQYDTIYHEHLRFYGLRPLQAILARAGFKVFDVERVPTHGGSIRVWADRGARDRFDRVTALEREEERLELYAADRLERFRGEVFATKSKLLEILVGLRSQGRHIVGVGAPARSSMLLNFCGIDRDLLDYIVEPSGSLKVGLYTPAGHIPIVEEQRMLDQQPDYALLLSWHIADELMPKLRERGFRGGYVVPLPYPRVHEPVDTA